MPIWKNIGGVLRKIETVYRWTGTQWQRFQKIRGHIGTALVDCYVPTIRVNITSDTSNANIFTLAGSPNYKCNVICTIGSGVKVISASAILPSLTTGSGWIPGSTLKIVNNGNIYGAGGGGGNGGSVSYPTANAGAPGNDGGDAIDAQIDITVDNTNGNIYGGGGGGGGGGSNHAGGGNDCYPGSGGGGGRGNNGGGAGPKGTASGCVFNYAAYDGSVGSETSAGAGGAAVGTAGAGGNGGDWGQAGAPGETTSRASGGAGGAGGYAIRLNGNSVTWLGGNNSSQVKGGVA